MPAAYPERYWLDDFGFLWRGPMDWGGPGRKFQWQRFEGVRKGGRQIWEWFDPNCALTETTKAVALKVIRRFIAEEG